MRRVGKGLVLSIALVLGAATLAAASQQVVLGKLLLVKDPFPSIDASKRRVVIVGQEDSPGAATLVGDPSVYEGSGGGALLQIVLDGGAFDGQVATYELPSWGWSRIPINTAQPLVGYRYRDSLGFNGPVRTATVKTQGGKFVLKVVLTGRYSPLDLIPPDPGTDGGMTFTINNGDAYCVTFGGAAGGSIVNSPATPPQNKLFRVSNTSTAPTVEAGCALPSPTTTTTTPATTSTTTTTIPADCAAAVTAGLITLPPDLPDQTTCLLPTHGVAEGCSDWEVLDTFPVADLVITAPGPARFYRWPKTNPGASNTECWYLYRANAGHTITANGVHCYNKTNCYVCAFDKGGARPTLWGQLIGAGGAPPGFDNCSICHAAGPVAPTATFKVAVAGATRNIQRTCAPLGGPRWLGVHATWFQQDAARKVGPPTKCQGTSCHNAFVKVPKACTTSRLPCPGNVCGVGEGTCENHFCVIARRAFSADGSMEGKKFEKDTAKNTETCYAFAASMGCDAVTDFGCPTTTTTTSTSTTTTTAP